MAEFMALAGPIENQGAIKVRASSNNFGLV